MKKILLRFLNVSLTRFLSEIIVFFNMAMNPSGIRRNLKNIVHNYSDAQVKVREATSNDPWGPPSTLMSEIADLTYNVVAFSEIMQMIWKRLNDHGRNWRHVYKALVLLEYLIKTGTEKVAQQCKENIYAIQTLKDFQYIEDNKDQGMNVREKAKQLVTLLKDDERFKNERARALKAKERFAQASSGISSDVLTASGGYRSDSFSTDSNVSTELECARPQTIGEEELQLQLALAMSKEEADQEEQKRKSDDVRLQMAITQSQEDFSVSPKDEIHPALSFGQMAANRSLDESRSGFKASDEERGSQSSLFDLLALAAPVSSNTSTITTDPWGMPFKNQTEDLDPWQPISNNNIRAASTPPVLSDPWAPKPARSTTPLTGFGYPDSERNVDFRQTIVSPYQMSMKKTPESFLGENSALVNLDALVSSKPADQCAPTTNPFIQNPFHMQQQQQQQQRPSINQLRSQQIGGSCSAAITTQATLSNGPSGPAINNPFFWEICTSKRNLSSCIQGRRKIHSKPNGAVQGRTIDENICDCLEPRNLVEGDVGITERVNPLSPFVGVIKQRYSDFIVNEIDTSNCVIKLTKLDVPEGDPEVVQDAIMNLGSDVVDKLENLLKTPDSAEPVVIKMSNDDSKEKRTKIHSTIRQNYCQLQSSTEERDGVKVIIVSHNKLGDKRKSNNWPVNQPNFLKFVMFKENRDTMDAVNTIAKALRVKTSSFSYSGVKDKRAKTSQLVTVYRISAERLAKLNLRGMTLGNYEYVKYALQLGDLNGNRFKIVLRKITGDGDLEEILTNLHKNGFINYYGMQRFGTSTVPTHHIGRALLLGNWKEAIELIMKPRPGENDELTECRKIWWETRDAKTALSKLFKKHIIEAHLLRGLSQNNPNDYIPRNTRLMYIHSYQSFIWNRIVSERIKKFGIHVLNGDLYFKKDDPENSDVIKTKRNNDMPSIYNSDDNDTNIDIFDVVMPLPGSSVIMPKNDVAQIYEEILKEENMDFSKSYSNVRAYALHGGYRKLVVLPGNMSSTIRKYDDSTIPLVFSDLEILKDSSSTTEFVESEESTGVHTAVCIEFSLPSSSYATMALREVNFGFCIVAHIFWLGKYDFLTRLD
uniref:ENTH domain-containing protein n=1 Tax=Strigamia maritima TaxID=126957 RepID=T1IV34_STRMM